MSSETSKDDNNDDSTGPSIEKVFDFLKEGKDYQSLEDYWNAADKFVQAQDMLIELAKGLHSKQQNQLSSEAIEREQQEEQGQIIKLYKQQALEYLFQSRQCLIEAMSKERSDDEDNDELDLLGEENNGNGMGLYCSLLTDEEAQIRTRTFAMLFSKKHTTQLDSEVKNNSNNDDTIDIPPIPSAPGEKEEGGSGTNDNIQEQQMSIEERLSTLNASIPSDMKSTKERMDDVNKGLNRLGLSLYAQKEPFARFKNEILPKDEDEQVADIMAQVEDEVAVEKQLGSTSKVLGKESTSGANDDFDDLTESDDDDDIDNETDLLLDDEQLAIKIIRSKIVKAQTRLAELVAYLDEAKQAKEKELKEDEDDLDNDDNDSIEKPDCESYLISGKKKLRLAQRDLKKALEEWNDNNLS